MKKIDMIIQKYLSEEDSSDQPHKDSLEGRKAAIRKQIEAIEKRQEALDKHHEESDDDDMDTYLHTHGALTVRKKELRAQLAKIK